MTTRTLAQTAPRPRTGLLAAGGLALVLIGIVGYFVFVGLHWGAYFPRIRNDAFPSWLLIVFGLGLVARAVSRAMPGHRVVPAIVLGLATAFTGAFALLVYVAWAVPPVTGPARGAPAPPFALADQRGKVVSLDSFRGAPLLLVFYRGHW